MPPPDIVEHFQATYALDVSYQLIYHYRKSETWSDFIAEERLAYDAPVSECLMCCKKKRMDALYATYLLAKEKQDPKGMVMAVAQAQKEMEGTKVRLTDKDGEDFQFNINIGPPPEEQKPKQVGPVLTLISPSKDDDEVD
jgi:hypothetical protein